MSSSTVAERKVRNREVFLVTEGRDHLLLQSGSLIDIGDQEVSFPAAPTVSIAVNGRAFPVNSDFGFSVTERIVAGTQLRIRVSIASGSDVLDVDKIVGASFTVSRSDEPAISKILGDGISWDEAGELDQPGADVLVIDLDERDTEGGAGLYRYQLIVTTDEEQTVTFCVAEGTVLIQPEI